MISEPIENPIIAISVRIYQVLLVAYPTKFQQEYGAEMLQVFRDCCLRAFRQSGTNGMLKLWAIALFDFLHSLIEEHLQKETFMTRSKFIRLSGWSLMVGAVTFFVFILVIFLATDVYNTYGLNGSFAEIPFLLSVWATPILLGVGLLGLRTRFGDEVGNFGNNVLMLGAIAGPVINIIGITIPQIGSWGWLLPFTGNAIVLACLSIFGIAALSAKPLARWNSLPLIAGVLYPIIIILMYIFEAMRVLPDAIGTLAFIGIPLQCVLLVVLGYMLQADVLEETAALA
ncbi:MAG: hypothetical protein P8Z00_13700 [Anaerolineales bacterium]